MRQAPKLPKRAQPESPNLQSTFRPSARSRQHGTRSAEFFHVQLQSQKRNCSFVSFKQQSQDRHEFARQVSTTPKTVTNGRTGLTSPHSSSLEVAVLMKPLPSQPSHHPTHTLHRPLLPSTQQPSRIWCLNKRLPPAAARVRAPLSSPANGKLHFQPKMAPSTSPVPLPYP